MTLLITVLLLLLASPASAHTIDDPAPFASSDRPTAVRWHCPHSPVNGCESRERAPHAGTHMNAAGKDEEAQAEWSLLRRALARLFLPFELAVMYELRDWIRALPVSASRPREEELSRVDEIYRRAVYLSEGDAQTALFACSWATLPYHRFPARIPLIGIALTVPVSTETRADFERRMERLPGRLFEDSPRGLDRDKLPHFFGTAWLYLATRSPVLALGAGEMLELGEAVFKVEGSRDPRDILINQLGMCFAEALVHGRDLRPSQILKHGLADNAYCTEAENPPRR